MEVIEVIVVAITFLMVVMSIVLIAYPIMSEYRQMADNRNRLRQLTRIQRHVNFKLCQLYRKQLEGGGW